MKKHHILSYISTLAVFSIYLSTTLHKVSGQPDGISGYSGAKSSCNICHAGIQTTTLNHENALLTSDIPSSGYIPGTTYNMTLYVKTQKPKLGFDIRAQNSKGTLVGTANNVTNGKILSGEVVHNSTNTVSGDHKTITFKWTAPSTGTGDVTFWGSIAINPMGTQSMDTLNKISVVFHEDQTIGLLDDYFTNDNLTISPTSTPNQFEIKYEVITRSNLSIKLYDLNGAMVRQLFNAPNTNPGEYTHIIDCSILKAGLYSILVQTNKEIAVKKICVY